MKRSEWREKISKWREMKDERIEKRGGGSNRMTGPGLNVWTRQVNHVIILDWELK